MTGQDPLKTCPFTSLYKEGRKGSVDYAECGVWKMRRVENAECGKLNYFISIA